jgi:hypothetical protein
VTTRKKVGKNEKRVNQTAHQHAMTRPEVREALIGLRACWSILTPRQLGEQLNELVGFECSVRGIAKELGKPETSIRRFITLAKQPEKDSNWIAMRERTCAEVPKEPSTMSAGEAVCHFPSKIPAKEIVGHVINETCPAQDHAHTSTAQQTKKITFPLSTRVKEPPVVNCAMSRQEHQVGEDTPKTSLVDAYMNRRQILDDKIQRLVAIPEQIKPRPIWNASSMKRQGKPVPPKDPQEPVS